MTRVSSISRNCVLCLLVMLLVLMWPVRAMADDFIVLPDWFDDYCKSLGVLPDVPPEYEIVLNREYVQKASRNEAPSSTGTTFETAVKQGKTTYFDGADELKISDAQRTLAEGYTEYTKDMQQLFPDSSNLSLDVHNRKMRMTSTSGGLQQAVKKAGEKNASTVIASATWGDTDLYRATVKKSGSNSSLAKKLLSKAGVVGGMRFLDVASGIPGDYVLGLDLGNMLLDVFKVDRTEECSVVTNKIARLLIGASSTCAQFDASSYDLPSYHYQLSNLCWLNSGVEYCISGSLSPAWDDYYKQAYVRYNGTTHSEEYGDEPYSHSFEVDDEKWAAIRFGENKATCSTNNYYFDYCEIGILSGLIGKIRPSSITKSGSLEKIDDGATGRVTHYVNGSDGKRYGSYRNVDGIEPTHCPWPRVKLPEGVYPVSHELTWTGSDGSPKVLQPETQITYHDPVDGTGTLDLQDAATGKSCYAEGTACADWAKKYEERTKTKLTVDTKGKTSTDPHQEVKCVWAGGSKVTELEIGQCVALRYAFDDGTGSVTDPDTGEKVDVGPKYDDTPDFAQCVKEDVSWNPVSWVFTPVKCALNWAFKPSEQQIRTVNAKMRQQTSTTFVDAIINAFKAQFTGRPDNESCLGPEFHLAWHGWTIIPSSHPASVCQGSGLEFLPTFSKAACIVLATAVSFLTVRKWAGAAVKFHDGTRTDLDAK